MVATQNIKLSSTAMKTFFLLFACRYCNNGHGPLHGKSLDIQFNAAFPFVMTSLEDPFKLIGGIVPLLLDTIGERLGFTYTPTVDTRSIYYINGTPGAAFGEVHLMIFIFHTALLKNTCRCELEGQT